MIETGTSLVWLFVALPISLPSANYWAMFRSFFSRSEILNSISFLCVCNVSNLDIWTSPREFSVWETSSYKKTTCPVAVKIHPGFHCGLSQNCEACMCYYRNQGKLAPFTSSQFFICTSDTLPPLALYGKWPFIIELTGSSHFHPIFVHYKKSEQI